MVNNSRMQLTLFVNGKDAENIEKIRQKFNPLQSELIESHITLCREDEIDNLEKVTSNLGNLKLTSLTIDFGKAVRFDNGKGVLLPAIGDNKAFQHLRQLVLCGLNDAPRQHEPHITLLHPRNATCTDEIFKQIETILLPNKLLFKTISLIEQNDGGQWKVLQEWG